MKGLKIIASFVVGAACGAGGMWLGMRKHFDTKAEQKISEARHVFHKMLKQARENPETKSADPEEFLKETSDQKTKVEDEPKEKTYKILEDRLGIKVPKGTVDTENIHEIPDRDFGNIEYPGQKLIWFSNDNQLVDPLTGKIFDEIEDLCGDEGTELLCSTDIDDFFIRNHELGLDIHVVMNFEDHYYEIYPQED